MYLPSNHVVYSVVVVLFLNFTQKFHSSLFGFFFISFVLLLFFLFIYVLICLFYCQITSHNFNTNNNIFRPTTSQNKRPSIRKGLSIKQNAIKQQINTLKQQEIEQLQELKECDVLIENAKLKCTCVNSELLKENEINSKLTNEFDLLLNMIVEFLKCK